MTPRGLDAEFELTQRPLGPASFARFRELGIPDRVIFGVRPLVGVALANPPSLLTRWTMSEAAHQSDNGSEAA